VKTYQQAAADVVAARIPLRNLHTHHGQPDDYGVDLPGYHDVPRDVYEAAENAWQEKAVDMVANPQDYPRRWAMCETSAGLAFDEAGEVAVFRDGQKVLERLGWEYMGSGGYRVEVEPGTVPDDDAV
jgi:hypothetical protein